MRDLLQLQTAGADGLCLPLSPNSYLEIEIIIFLNSSTCEERSKLLEADVFLAQTLNFLIFQLGTAVVLVKSFCYVCKNVLFIER